MMEKKFLLRLFVLHLFSIVLILGSSSYYLRSKQKKSFQKFSAGNLNGDIYVDSIYNPEKTSKKTPEKPRIPLRTLTPEEYTQLSRWIELLGDEQYTVRENAYAKILQMGRDVLPHLKKQTTHPDLQIRETIQELVSELASE